MTKRGLIHRFNTFLSMLGDCIRPMSLIERLRFATDGLALMQNTMQNAMFRLAGAKITPHEDSMGYYIRIAVQNTLPAAEYIHSAVCIPVYQDKKTHGLYEGPLYRFVLNKNIRSGRIFRSNSKFFFDNDRGNRLVRLEFDSADFSSKLYHHLIIPPMEQAKDQKPVEVKILSKPPTSLYRLLRAMPA